MGQSASTPSSTTSNPSSKSWTSSSTHDTSAVSRLRTQAFAESQQRRDLSQRSQAAYRARNGELAKSLSDEARRHGDKAARLHALAAKENFRAYNPEYPGVAVAAVAAAGGGGSVSQAGGWFGWLVGLMFGAGKSDEKEDAKGGKGKGKKGKKSRAELEQEREKKTLEKIDLHGLLVPEATEKVRAHLAMCRSRGVARTTIVTGRGAHSGAGGAKIKPAVEELLQRDRGVGIVRVVGGAGEGAIVVVVNEERRSTVMDVFGQWAWDLIPGR